MYPFDIVNLYKNEKDAIQIADRVFNLEGGVEFGGQLRIVELNQDLTWKTIEIDSCQPITETTDTTDLTKVIINKDATLQGNYGISISNGGNKLITSAIEDLLIRTLKSKVGIVFPK